MPNHLIHEKSPYLLQHAYNPVDWYSWSPEAFDRAIEENKPIFLSIGYATCHWCHVMAHESFEDEEVAAILNRDWVTIKVDREERPDVDQIYMTACQVLTGQGGWPLSAFLTPEGAPFYVGTYFPKVSRFGRPGFMDLLAQLGDKWRTDNAIVRKAADQLTDVVRKAGAGGENVAAPDLEILQTGYQQHADAFDRRYGGFGQAPKFPSPHHLGFLLRWHRRTGETAALDMVEQTLTAMRHGGIFDHIGLGFHRYSVDETWLVPHFEKMLYDQALLALAYTEAYQVTGKKTFAQAARDIFTYVLRDMTSPEGGFYTAEDADSEGREGLFYVWKPEEVTAILGEDTGRLFSEFYDINEAGNFEEGLSIPHVTETVEAFCLRKGLNPDETEKSLAQARQALFEARNKRVHPLKDDKILTAWNGLMLAALAKGSQALGETNWVEAAVRAYGFISSRMMDDSGHLMRRYRDGEAAHSGYLDDYVFLIWGLIELYEATLDLEYLDSALALNRTMLELFRDDRGGGLYFSGRENEVLIANHKDIFDGALPSANSVAALNLLRLGRMTGDVALEQEADRLISSLAGQAAQHPIAHSHFLMALDFMIGPSQEMVIAAEYEDADAAEMLTSVRRAFLPSKVLLFKTGGARGDRLAMLAPFAAKITPLDGRTAFYLCQNYACRNPVTDPGQVKELINDL